jgi:hypothetical protein
MNTRITTVGALLVLSVLGPGCLGGGPGGAVGSEQSALSRRPNMEAVPSSETAVTDLARELWLAGDECAQAGREAQIANLDVRWNLAGPLDQFLFVQIDGIMACAGDSRTLTVQDMRVIRLESGTSPDQGGPDPEPANPSESGPDPEPATHDHTASGDTSSTDSGSDSDQSGGEDKGGPDPEPAFSSGGKTVVLLEAVAAHSTSSSTSN